MRAAATVAVVALVIMLFASVTLVGFLVYDREATRAQLDEARRFGFLPIAERPGCGWVKVPRCERCGRFHAPPPPIVFPGPAISPEMIEVYPTPAPPRLDVIPPDRDDVTPDDFDAYEGRIYDGAFSDQGDTRIAGP